MQLACPHCRKPLKVGRDHAGRQLRCPKCQGTFDAPTTPTAVTATPPLPATDAVTVKPRWSNREDEQADLDSMDPWAGGDEGPRTIVYTGACARLLALGGVGIILILVCVALNVGGRHAAFAFLLALVVALPFVIFNLLAARNLRTFGSKGLVIAGCVLSLIAGGGSVILLVLAMWSFVRMLRVPGVVSVAWPLLLINIAVVGFAAFFLIFGSIRALLCLNHPDVKARMK
jgi:hypothetical protein